MNTVFALVLLCIVLLVCYDAGTSDSFSSSRAVCNNEDNRCYKVIDKYENTAQASKILADLNKFSIRLMRHLRNKYVFGDLSKKPEYQNRVSVVKFLLNNYNPDNIKENAPIGDVNTSYVDDKGKVFALCLREKKSGENKFHTMEELEFVVIHEMTHMATVSFGHEPDFWANFKFMLQEAELAGLHTPVNYQKYPMVYCSLLVNYSPYFDDTLPNI